MTRCAPASAATAHSDAAGSTVSVLPIAIIRSQAEAARTAAARTARSSGWPNMTGLRGAVRPHGGPGRTDRQFLARPAEPGEPGLLSRCGVAWRTPPLGLGRSAGLRRWRKRPSDVKALAGQFLAVDLQNPAIPVAGSERQRAEIKREGSVNVRTLRHAR